MISVSDPPLEETIARRTAEEEEETKSSKRKSFATNQRVPAATGKEFRRLLNKFSRGLYKRSIGTIFQTGGQSRLVIAKNVFEVLKLPEAMQHSSVHRHSSGDHPPPLVQTTGYNGPLH